MQPFVESTFSEAAQSVAAIIAMVDMTIKKLLDSVRNPEDSRLVSVIDTVLDLLEKNSMAWKMQLPPKLVGIHPRNRGGWGVGPGAVHSLGARVVKMGWSAAATSLAVCVEDDGTSAEFTDKLVKASDGLLCARGADVKYGSLSCSHTNQFLVCLTGGAKTEFQDLAIDGCMSYDKVCARDQNLKHAADKGIVWLVVSAKAVQKFPQLPDLIQAARNAPGTVHEREDAFQLLHKLQSMACTSLKASGSVDWTEISRSIQQMSQCTPEDVQPLIAFCQKYGGGTSTAFVDDLCKFAKLFGKPGRVVPNTTWQSLADMKVGVAELCPLVVYAIVKLQIMSPPNKVESGKFCKYVTAGEINSLATSKKSSMLEAEGVLRECRTLARGANINDETCRAALGRLDVFIAKIVLGKKDNTTKSTVQEAAADFAKDIGLGGGVQSTPAEPTPTVDATVVDYDEDGHVVSTCVLSLKAAGLNVGATVKSGDSLYTIAKVHDDGRVELQCLQTLSQTVVASDVLLEQYKKTTETYEEFDSWDKFMPSKQTSYTDAVARAHVLAAIAAVANDVDTPKIKIIKKPAKAIVSCSNVGVNKLCLVPETMKITFASTETVFNGTIDGQAYYLQPMPFSESFAAPAWVVKTTSDEESANVHVVHRKITLTVGSTTANVHVPVLSNHRKIKTGDELALFKAPAEKKASKRPLSLSIAPTKAKAKSKAMA